MKVLVIVLSFALAVIEISAQTTTKKGKGINGKPAPNVDAQNKKAAPAGCDNPPVGVKVSDCCPLYPNFNSNKTMASSCTEKCSKTDPTKKFCCFIDCAMEYFGFTTGGKFDAAKAKKAVATLTHGLKGTSVTWTTEYVSKTVDDCVANAPTMLKEWPKGVSSQCTGSTPLNMVIGHCLRRALFFECPGFVVSKECNALFDFGKGCTFFPFE